MAVNIPGLLGKLAGLPEAITSGLLGPLPQGQGLGLDPSQMAQARQSAVTDMAYGLVAGSTAPGWRNPGATVAVARQNALGNYRGRIFDMLKEKEYKKMQDEEATLNAQLAAFRQANPDKANLPDAVILKYMDPNYGLQESQLGLQQQQFAATLQNNAEDNRRADAQFELQRQQMEQARANAERNYELERLKMQQEEQRFRAQLKASGSKADPTEARQRRDKATGAWGMLSTLDKLRSEVETNGTELFGAKAGVQGSLYGQALSEYKQAKQLGTLDKGLLDLFDKMLLDPTSWGAAANPFAKSKILSQLDTLIAETEDQYNRDYSYLKANGIDDGFQPRQAPIGSASFLRQLEQEGAKRKLW